MRTRRGRARHHLVEQWSPNARAVRLPGVRHGQHRRQLSGAAADTL